MRVDDEANLTPERFARLGIEPIEPGKTFRLIRPDTYVSGAVAREILEMYPKRSQIWMRTKDLTEIAVNAIFAGTTGVLSGVLAEGMGIALLMSLSIPRMMLTGEVPFSFPLTSETTTNIQLLTAHSVSYGGLLGSGLATWGAIENPHNRIFRFSYD